MAKKNEKKTNAMRELDRIGAAYDTHIWDCAEAMNGVEVADHLGLEVGSRVQDARYCGKIRHPLCLHGAGC